jgi:hypothetical protein
MSLKLGNQSQTQTQNGNLDKELLLLTRLSLILGS